MKKENMKAPDFSLIDQNGELVQLSNFLGKKVIVYFYPKDHTPGCTRQACAFKSSFDEFKNKDIIVIGISRDTTESHLKFTKDYELPFILLSDPDLEVIKLYNCWKEKNMFGKLTFGMTRSTFIIDENGFIIKHFEKANPDTNAQEILDFIG